MGPVSETIVQDISEILDSLHSSLRHFDGKSVLITGSTGMVGQYVALTILRYAGSLPEESAPTVYLHARSRAKAEGIFGQYLGTEKVSLLIDDVTDLKSKNLPRVDLVIHAASPASPEQFKNNPVGVIEANALATSELLKHCSKYDATFCFISTMEVYGELGDEGAVHYVDECDYGALDSLALRSAYPESKRLAETLSRAYFSQYGVKCLILRLTHTYGPGMGLDDTRVQTEFIRKALENSPIVLRSSGESLRTYTYISDATTALFIALADEDLKFEVYNVANRNVEVTIRELAEAISLAAGGSKHDVQIVLSEPDELRSKSTGRVIVRTERLEARGWEAQISLEEGLTRTINHYRETI